MEPSSVEKQSLEAHVEICAIRYQSLDNRLNQLEQSIVKVESLIAEVHEIVESLNQKNTDRVVSWGVSLIGTMAGVIGWLVVTYVIKA